MRIVIGSDHAGFPLKESLRKVLIARGHEVADVGAHYTDASDYPDYGRKVAEAVAQGRADYGISVCGSGIGMCMAANKVKGIRAAVLRNAFDARFSREHNDANVACLGGRVTGEAAAAELVEIFLHTPFEGGRHARRVEKLEP